MAKLLFRATALLAFGLGYVGVASAAADTEFRHPAAPTYAAEMFDASGMSTMDLSTNTPTYVYLVIDNDAQIEVNHRAALTLTLTGAKLASRVRSNDVKLATVGYTPAAGSSAREFEAPYVYDHDGDTGTPDQEVLTAFAASTVEDGGSKGDSFVEFEITPSAVIPAPTGTTHYAIRVELPALMDVSARGVSLSFDLDPIQGNFPVQVTPLLDPLPLVNKAKAAMSITPVPGKATISLEDRTKIVVPPTGVMTVATVTLAVDPMVLQSDGKAFSVENRRTSDGAGDVIVSVAGDLRADDSLGWDWNGTLGLQKEEMITIASDGSAERAFDLDALFITDAGAQRASVSGGLSYTPGGKDPLRNGSLAVSVVIDFDSSELMDTLPARSAGSLGYGKPTSKAYALAPASAGDETNVRLRCGASFPCIVYMACDAADGTGFFGKMSEPIAPWSVTTVDSEAIAEVIGAEDADFAGRMSCEVIGPHQVQVLTRSDGVLVNNSYVGEAN